MYEKEYLIPESQLMRLISRCANANHCSPNRRAHCACWMEVIKADRSIDPETISDIPKDTD